eukprot:GHVT01069136.1.p1 GENE.GHVT01069136.1~~GHVT01069136.1.p1  ORF type:complete len:122 (-),score=1.01 GHVT01069136.1:554-919(-)
MKYFRVGVTRKGVATIQEMSHLTSSRTRTYALTNRSAEPPYHAAFKVPPYHATFKVPPSHAAFIVPPYHAAFKVPPYHAAFTLRSVAWAQLACGAEFGPATGPAHYNAFREARRAGYFHTV